MRTPYSRLGMLAAALSLAWLAGSAPAHADDTMSAARALAERFSGNGVRDVPAGAARTVEPAARPDADEESRIIEEIEMLERARAEAEARRETLVKEREAAEAEERAAEDGSTAKIAAKERAKEAERQIAAERAKAAEATRQADEARRKADEIEQRIAEEKERAEAAVQAAAEAARKVADAERRLAEERARAATAVRDAEARRQAEEERRLAAERAQAAEALQAAQARKKELEDAEMKRLIAERDAEARRIEEALSRAREVRERRARGESVAGDTAGREPRQEMTTAPASVETAAATAEPATSETPRHEARPEAGAGPAPRHWDRGSTRVSVLIVMEPGRRGIRKHNKTGDPLMCGEQGCYVSAGADAPADLLPMRRAFGAGRTLGERAGACSNSLGCVFRGIDLVAFPAILQPVDMRFLKHDRRQPQVLSEGSACELEAGRLACTSIEGPDYRMWVVPEDLAEAAGPAALAAAVESGLPTAQPGERAALRR